MYTIVLTSLDGKRTFCYCQRIRPEGSDLSLPLAVCILSRHKDRLLFQNVRFHFSTLESNKARTDGRTRASVRASDAIWLDQSCCCHADIASIETKAGKGFCGTPKKVASLLASRHWRHTAAAVCTLHLLTRTDVTALS